MRREGGGKQTTQKVTSINAITIIMSSSITN